MTESNDMIRLPARVIGCLRPGVLQVIVGYGIGMMDGGIPTDIPVDTVPLDLRTPNSVFTVLLSRSDRGFLAIER